MPDTQPMQANGQDGAKGRPDGTNEADGAGESGGGAYPNPHTRQQRERQTGVLGQSGIYGHGGDRSGDDKADEDGAGHSTTRRE